MTTKFETQIAALKNLHPRAAAWLADVPAATLRDNAHKLTPNESGTYDAREVAAWAQNRASNNEITGDDAETVLLIGEQLSDAAYEIAPVIARLIRVLYQRHSQQIVNTGIIGMVLAIADEQNRSPVRLRTEAEIAQEIRNAIEHDAIWQDQRQLNIGYTCPKCKRTRHGRDWKKGVPTAGRRMLELLCPNCEG